MEKIRVGMIRCDVHACWYGLLFAPVDEEVLFKYFPQNQYYYFYKHKLKLEPLAGFELTRIWDGFPPHRGISRSESETLGNAEVLHKVFMNKPKICETVEEVSDDVDLVFIADCWEEGTDHLALAAPGLKKGVPTFVDKPFACALTDAREMVRLARENDTPLLSLSLLNANPIGEHFRNRFAEIAPVGMGIVKGVGTGGLNAIIHGLSLAQNVFGQGVESVECMGTLPLEFVHMHYPKSDPELPHGVDVLVISSYLSGPDCGFRCEAYSAKGSIHSPWIDDFQFPRSGQVILRKLKQMVETRRPPVPYESMLELIEIVEAGRKAQTTGKPVRLNDIRNS